MENPGLVEQMERTATDPESRIRSGRPRRERDVDALGQQDPQE